MKKTVSTIALGVTMLGMTTSMVFASDVDSAELNNNAGDIIVSELSQDNGSVKSNDNESETVAKLVIDGKFGNGSERKAKLAEAGHDYDSVQAVVNQIVKGNSVEKTSISSRSGFVLNQPEEVETPATIEKEKETSVAVEKEVKSTVQGNTMNMKASAYSTQQPSLSRYTANGTDLHVNSRVIAVDPKVIPLGSTVEIEGYGTYTAADTGGAIKGNRIDMHFKTVAECIEFGRKDVKVTVQK